MKPTQWSSLRNRLVEFVVVVLGITVSFSLDGWRQDRITSDLHLSEIRSLLEDLEQDKERLSRVSEMIEEGDSSVRLILNDILAYRENELSYSEFALTLQDVGTPYQYGTFFMNTSTYTSLVATGRLQLFPEHINRKLRDYYEYVSKRVDDNNEIVDGITLTYYNEYHPWVNFQSLGEEDTHYDDGIPHSFFRDPAIKRLYSDVSFLTATLALQDRIRKHSGQVAQYERLRDELEALLSQL